MGIKLSQINDENLTDDTKNRYNILKARLIKELLKQVDEKVINYGAI